MVISRDKDFASKSPETSSAAVNFISTSNNELFKSSYKEINEKNSVVNSTYLRKGNLQDFPRNQVYFGKTQLNSNLKNNNNINLLNPNSNSISQNNFSSKKFNEFDNRNHNAVNVYNNNHSNNLNVNHHKYPSYVSPLMEKTGNRYEISPIMNNGPRSKSKYILYDSTKNFVGNMNAGGINSYNNNVISNNSNNQNYNFKYNLQGNNLANVLGKI